MEIYKAQFASDKQANHAMSGYQGVKVIRLGSALIWLSNMQNKQQATNAYHSMKGHRVDPTREDKEKLISSL